MGGYRGASRRRRRFPLPLPSTPFGQHLLAVQLEQSCSKDRLWGYKLFNKSQCEKPIDLIPTSRPQQWLSFLHHHRVHRCRLLSCLAATSQEKVPLQSIEPNVLFFCFSCRSFWWFCVSSHIFVTHKLWALLFLQEYDNELPEGLTIGIRWGGDKKEPFCYFLSSSRIVLLLVLFSLPLCSIHPPGWPHHSDDGKWAGRLWCNAVQQQQQYQEQCELEL